MRRWLVPVAALALVLAFVVVGVGVAVRADDASDSPAAAPSAPTPSASERGAARRVGHRAAGPGAGAVLLPGPSTGRSARTATSAPRSRCRSTTTDPSAGSIDLALLRVPATGKRVGSLVVNPGGPGSPGTDYAAGAETVLRRPLLDAFDVVGFDPRGTGDSSPVDCLSDAGLDAFLAQDPDPDTAAEGATFADEAERLGAGCAELSPDAAGHVTTIEAARDLDVLRAALGEEQLTYLGASYGTKLGATYAELFPERVGRLVLDGAVDVSLSSRDLALGQATGFQTALEAYVENCVEETEACFLGDSVDEGLQRIRDFLDEVDAATASDRVRP